MHLETSRGWLACAWRQSFQLTACSRSAGTAGRKPSLICDLFSLLHTRLRQSHLDDRTILGMLKPFTKKGNMETPGCCTLQVVRPHATLFPTSQTRGWQTGHYLNRPCLVNALKAVVVALKLLLPHLQVLGTKRSSKDFKQGHPPEAVVGSALRVFRPLCMAELRQSHVCFSTSDHSRLKAAGRRGKTPATETLLTPHAWGLCPGQCPDIMETGLASVKYTRNARSSRLRTVCCAAGQTGQPQW